MSYIANFSDAYKTIRPVTVLSLCDSDDIHKHCLFYVSCIILVTSVWLACSAIYQASSSHVTLDQH